VKWLVDIADEVDDVLEGDQALSVGRLGGQHGFLALYRANHARPARTIPRRLVPADRSRV